MLKELLLILFLKRVLLSSQPDCIVDLIEYIFKENDTLHIIVNNETKGAVDFPISNPLININIDKPIYLKSIYYDNFMIYAKNYMQLHEIMNILNNSQIWHVSNSPRSFFIIISQEELNETKTSQMIFSFDITNVIITSPKSGRWQSFIFDPYDKASECGIRIKPRIYDNCDRNIFENFGKRLMMLNGCPLKAPFSLAKDEDSIFNYMFSVVVNVIAEALNTTVSRRLEFSHENREYIYIAASLLYNDILSAHYDFLQSVYYQDVVWVVPAPLRTLDIKIITSVFSLKIWLTIMVVFFFTLIMWWIVIRQTREPKEVKTISFTGLTVFALSIGSSTTFAPKTNTMKHIWFTYTFYSLILFTLFQARLIDVLTHPIYEKGIRTMEDLAESNLTITSKEILATDFYLKDAYLNNSVYSKMYGRIVTFNVMHEKREITTIAIYRNISTFVAKDALKLTKKYNSKIRIIEDTKGLRNFDLICILRRGHFIYHTVNNIIQRIIQSGITQRFLNDLNNHIFEDEEYLQDDSQVKLSLNHLHGIFALWGIGLGFAIIILIGELLYDKHQHSNNKNIGV